ncbi:MULTISPECIES: pyridoxal-phosphate dependent enzyme [unclassified Roseitalea]|uniref:pyridoxal-phosphate dependent enzyme n=1 Tax=unclassified Roseitalea TaxID=2639107 RepID=UPI00273D271C|nr:MULTISPECIES: pyridoxal-phosphate dependent enzyme [unclassified Roseitalea]
MTQMPETAGRTRAEPPAARDVDLAAQRIAGHIHRTPVLTSSFVDALAGATVFFKCENFQKTGSFKARGASNAVLALADDDARRGVVTHSSGNHGQAIAYAAARRGIEATIVMPENANAAKKAAVRGYGGAIVECAPSASARQATLEAIVAQTGAVAIHPYNDPLVIAGQGTCAAELLAQLDAIDAVIAPVGGGGLISGTGLFISERKPSVVVYGAEPQAADHARRSLRAGRPAEPADAPVTVADGLKAPLGDLTWACVSDHVRDVFAVGEPEIIAAMRLVWERMKIVIEPSCAVPVAAILANRAVFAGQRVGVILTGGNVDLDRLPWAG